MYYIYCYIDPIKNEPFYIGKGNKKRVKSHLWKSVYESKKTPFYDKIKSLIKKDIKPIVKILYIVKNEYEAYKIETEEIKKIGTRFDDIYKGPLLNLNLGGLGGITPCREVRKKISEKNKGKFTGKNNGNYINASINYKGKGNPFYGKKHSQKTLKKMKREYYIIYPGGDVVEINGLYDFCKNHSIFAGKLLEQSKKMQRYKKMFVFKKDMDRKEIIKKLENLHIQNQTKKLRKDFKEEMDIQLPKAIKYFKEIEAV